MPTTTPFNNLITFSRGSNATLTGPNGLIQWAPNNLLTFSEQFNDGAWTKAGTTISANTTAAPDGTTTADKQIEDTSTGDHRILNNIAATVTANVTYTWSVYAKAAERTSVRVTNNSLIGATFDLTDGTFSNVSAGITAASTSVGNGWYRLAITGLAATSSERLAVYLVSGGATSYTGNGASGAFIWGAQLELGSTATTYNPTTVKNLLGFSEAFDNAAWTKSNSSIITGAQANPINGLFTAQKLMENTANSVHRFIVGATVTAIPYTLSIYAKAAERNWIAVGNTSDGQLAHFNLTNGTVGTILGGATAAITNIGSGWYRCSVTFTPTAGSRTLAVWLASADNTLTYTGDGNSGVYIYGAQLSDSASLDPYVPTPGAAPSSTAFYGPRFDFDPVTLLPRGILIEEQRTNLFVQSENLATTWSVTRATISSNVTTSPDGTSNADKLVEDTSASTTHLIQQSIAGTIGAVETLSIYAKPSGRTWMQIQIGSISTAYFDIANGVVGTVSNATATITNAGNGWYRCAITATRSGNQNNIIFTANANNGNSYTGDGTSGLFLYGAQLEAGAFATSYIPTIASTVTRSADVATITGQNFAQWYNSSAGSFIAEFRTIETGVVSATSYVLAMDTSGSKRIIYVASGADVATTFDGTTIIGAVGDVTGINAKVASAYDGSGRAIVSNGGAVATGAVVAAYSASTVLNIGSLGGGQSLGHIRNIRFIPARAADFQLQGLST